MLNLVLEYRKMIECIYEKTPEKYYTSYVGNHYFNDFIQHAHLDYQPGTIGLLAFQYRQIRFRWNIHTTVLHHFFLTFLLLFKQLPLSSVITTVQLRRDVFS